MATWPGGDTRSTAMSTGPCRTDGKGVPSQSATSTGPGRKRSGKYRPPSRVAARFQAISGPRESSSQKAAALTRYRQAKLTSRASRTDSANSGYVAGRVGARRWNASAPTSIGTANRVSAANPARPRSLPRYVITGCTGRSRSDTTSPVRIRSESRVSPHTPTVASSPWLIQTNVTSWSGAYPPALPPRPAATESRT
jgi:hypothetical protein